MSLVRTVPGHLMRPSKAKDEFSEAGTCRAQAENKQKTSRRRSLSLVRTVPGHLMRPSKAKDEFSEAGTCRAQAEPKQETSRRRSLSLVAWRPEKLPVEGSNGRTVFIKFSKVGHREMKSLKIPILQGYYEGGITT